MMSDVEQQPGEENDDEDDGFVYHYTSLEAFTNIIHTRTLWASHIKYLNDTSEQEIMKSLAVDKLLRPLTESNPSRASEEHLRSFFEGISLPTFIVCFSADGGDRLSQWRAYGGNSGISLKFERERLYEWSDLESGVILQQAQYVSPNGDDFTRIVIDGILDRIRGVGSVLNLHITAALFKHRAFEEEKEWRLITNPVDGIVKHRARGSLLVPYVELTFGEAMTQLLAAVIVGPINHKEQTAEAIKGFLRTNGFTSTEVRVSETPYRGF
jgi:hypothetical protein